MLTDNKLTVENLKRIFEARSIAVIGASTREGSVGHDIFLNLITGGYCGILYGVNPKGGSICGIKLYPSISDVPEPVELAIVIVPSHLVPGTVEECAKQGVRGAVVITAGFKEIGPEGERLEDELKKVIHRTGISLVGPNCLGIINTSQQVQINASFARKMPKQGNIAFLSQSGALCTAVLDFAQGRNIGFSKFVSFGNKADVTEVNILQYLAQDAETHVVLMYLEDIADGAGFIQVARELTGDAESRKPILAIKAGRTHQGAQAAASHTGSLAGTEEAYDAVFAQSGILRVESIEELFDYAICFSSEPLPQGNRVAIITNAGGPGILTTDAAIRNGLELAVLSPETIAQLQKCLPPTANTKNPIDVIGDARHDRYEAAIECVLKDPGVDGLIIILTPQSMTDIVEIAQAVVQGAHDRKKPILCSFMGLVDVSRGVHILEANHIPNYTFPEAAARSLAAMVKYSNWVGRRRSKVVHYEVDQDRAKTIISNVRQSGRTEVTEPEGLGILKAYGFPVLEHALARSAPEARQAAERMRGPFAIKIVSPDILHKSDVGGVKLNVTAAVMEAEYSQFVDTIQLKRPQAELRGVLIEPMAERGGREVILGMKRDPVFGPLLMFGFGGVFVEVFKDVSFRVAPLREASAEKMVRAIKGYKLLKGFRGEAPFDIPALKEYLMRLSQLALELPEIEELDINPLIVYPEGQGCLVADTRMLLSPKPS